jgi:hypothetical protein
MNWNWVYFFLAAIGASSAASAASTLKDILKSQHALFGIVIDVRDNLRRLHETLGRIDGRDALRNRKEGNEDIQQSVSDVDFNAFLGTERQEE